MAKEETKLVAINVHKPDEQVIKVCEQLLEKARSGELIGLIAVEVKREHWAQPILTDSVTVESACFGLRLLDLTLNDLMRKLNESA